MNPTIIEDQTENPIVVNEIPKDQEQLTTIKGKTATEISTNKEPSLIIEQSKSLTEVTDAEGEKKIISAAKDLVAKASQKNAEIAKTGPKDEELATAIDELNLFISYNETVNQIKETSQEIQKLNASKTRLKTNKTELQAAKFRFNELSKNLSVTNKEIQTRTGEKVTISNFSARIKESYSRLKNLYETTSNKTEVIPNAINVDAKKIDTQPQKIETPNEVAKVTTFSIENKELRTIITDLLPKKELNGPKTPEISVDLVINTVNKIQDKEARETIQDLLKQGIVILAQEHMGMRQESRFSDNRATGILDQETLNRMQLPRLLRK